MYSRHKNELTRVQLILMQRELFFYGFIIYKTIFNQTIRKGFCFRFNRYYDQWDLRGDNGYNYSMPELPA